MNRTHRIIIIVGSLVVIAALISALVIHIKKDQSTTTTVNTIEESSSTQNIITASGGSVAVSPTKPFDTLLPITVSGLDSEGKHYTFTYTPDRWETTVITQNETKTLLSISPRGTDAATSIVLTDTATHAGTILGSDSSVEYSPDKKHLFVAGEHALIVVEANTLTYKTLFKPDEGTAYGVYSEFPSFYPKARWVSNDRIEVSIYPKYTSDKEPLPKPTQVRIITI